MTVPSIPQNEEKRQASLDKYKILDTLQEEEYDNITQLAARILDVPIALVSLVDNDRQWFKSRVGLSALETSREISFCGHAINYDDVFVVENALEDERFSDNPLVTDGLNIRFYAGAQLSTEDGFNIGTLCAIDDKPKILSEEDKKFLKILSKNVMNLLELRYKNSELKIQIEESTIINAELSKILAEKERNVQKSIESGTQKIGITKSIQTFDVIKSLQLTKNSVTSDLSKNNNKIFISGSGSIMIDSDENTVAVVIKNIFLLMSEYLKDEAIRVKVTPSDKKCQIDFKNMYINAWQATIGEREQELLNAIKKNILLINSSQYAATIKAKVILNEDLKKGFEISILL
jgi:hypothetical protein